MKIKIKWCLVFITVLLVIPSKGQNVTGVIASKLNDNAPDETVHWGKLVGNWDIVFEAINEKGEVTQSFDGEWNWFYTLNGHAIQDVFILPPRSSGSDPSTLFYGTGIKIYNSESKKWQSCWVDTSDKKLGLREAISTDEKIILYETKANGEKTKITYFDMKENTFSWQQEIQDGDDWIINQVIRAKRAN